MDIASYARKSDMMASHRTLPDTGEHQLCEISSRASGRDLDSSQGMLPRQGFSWFPPPKRCGRSAFHATGAPVHSSNVMAAITLEIPEDIAARLRFPPARASEELRREFAVFLVREGILPRHQARKLAEIDRIAFDDLLAHRQVAWEST